MPRQSRPWKEQMNKGGSRYRDYEEEEKPQKKIDDFIEEENNEN